METIAETLDANWSDPAASAVEGALKDVCADSPRCWAFLDAWRQLKAHEKRRLAREIEDRLAAAGLQC
ncbi:MAG: hypothetical protein AAFV49_04875 [Pseudomonadota bacterium]